MKRVSSIIIAMIFCISFFSLYACKKKTPENTGFENYTSEMVKEVTIIYGRWIYDLTPKEIDDSLPMFRKMSIVGYDDSVEKLIGDDFWQIRVTFQDATVSTIDLASPYLFVNGECYRVKKEDCDELYDFFHTLLKEKCNWFAQRFSQSGFLPALFLLIALLFSCKNPKIMLQ